VLITGMSGVGKSSVLTELSRRGHAVVDTDYNGFCEEETLPDGRVEQRWREDRIEGCSTPIMRTRSSSPALCRIRGSSIRGSTRLCC
jgi:predicted ATPase